MGKTSLILDTVDVQEHHSDYRDGTNFFQASTFRLEKYPFLI